MDVDKAHSGFHAVKYPIFLYHCLGKTAFLRSRWVNVLDVSDMASEPLRRRYEQDFLPRSSAPGDSRRSRADGTLVVW